jgi:hypothetical protein
MKAVKEQKCLITRELKHERGFIVPLREERDKRVRPDRSAG